MNSILKSCRSLRLSSLLLLGVCSGNVVRSAPTIESIEVFPNPPIAGLDFTVVVTASRDATLGTATVDFRPAIPRILRIPLVQQGLVWNGRGVIPPDIQLPPGAGATVRVLLFDASRQVTQGILNVGVHVESISAIFAGGILTVTGDDQDNKIVVSRDVSGAILVNGGAIAVSGGVPTIANTSLVRIYGLKGNDVLQIDDSNGPMPPANLLGGEGDDNLTGSNSDDELDGGPGNDTLNGRGGNDTLIGGDGNDMLIGGPGADNMFGGAGDDQFLWNPGDGSDLIEGETGHDTMVFNGSNVAETIDLSANGQRLRFFRNVGNITMDCAGIEQVTFRALSGADVITVNDLTGTEVNQVNIDLSLGAPANGDGFGDTVIVNGTAGDDHITLTGWEGGAEVHGLSAAVAILGGEPDLDELVINALGGADVVDASAVQAGALDLTLNGGDGDDEIIGGAGNDLINGQRGNDTLLGGAGDDTFVWNPGDGSDVIEGQSGQDTLLFNGANVNETVDLSANGQRLRFFRNVANITMDCNSVELIQFNALGGADTITVNDLTGTGVAKVNLDLASSPGSGIGDGQADTVIVNGTSGSDNITVTGSPATGVNVLGLSAEVSIVGSEADLDRLVINALAGDDVIEASRLSDGVIQLTEDGGEGADVLVGSAGPDLLLGGQGDDVLEGGPGNDVLDGGPGNNVVIQ